MKKYSKKGKRWMMRKNNGQHSDEDAATLCQSRIEKIKASYDFIERRELAVKSAADLPQLGGIYSTQMLNYSKTIQPESQDEQCFKMEHEEEDNPRCLLVLPRDGGIFHNGIPFYHYALTPLKEKHLMRLKQNGIQLRRSYFSSGEDKQIVENWRSFSSAHNIPEMDASKYMSAATAEETIEEHKERIRFIHTTLFRPWMCMRLLNRTALQVFRRCYHLFRVSFTESIDFRKWTAEDDNQLLELVKLHGNSWELIGNRLLHPRYSCYRRYRLLTGIPKAIRVKQEPSTSDQDDDEANFADGEWSRVEVARLYNYLSDALPRNPVVVATKPKYENLDADIDWCNSRLRLPSKSAPERKRKWDELKCQFKSAKERMQTEDIKRILCEVIPEDTRILAKARIRCRQKYLSPIEISDDLALLRDYCSQHQFEKLRQVDPIELEKKLKTHGELKYPVGRFLSRVKYMLYCAYRINLFKMLPVTQDIFKVRLELLEFILKNINSFRIRKKVLRKYTRRFLKMKGWQQRDDVVFVLGRTEEEEADEKWESSKDKVDLMQKRV